LAETKAAESVTMLSKLKCQYIIQEFIKEANGKDIHIVIDGK
jgi:glutathione synthase/RimK-type ligase-like ATP-grasp enzyme